MEIKLKSLRTYEKMSEETNAFTADIFVDGKNVGSAKNDGGGGNTYYSHHYDKDENKMREMKEAISNAEEYCAALPPSVYDKGGKDEMVIPMTLEYFIDDMVQKSLEEKELKKIEKKFDNKILFGSINHYAEISWGKNWPITKMLLDQKGRDMIKKTISEQREKNPNGKLLNTNIPAELI